MPKVVIVGAGISGLSLAYRKSQTLTATQQVAIEAGRETSVTLEIPAAIAAR